MEVVFSLTSETDTDFILFFWQEKDAPSIYRARFLHQEDIAMNKTSLSPLNPDSYRGDIYKACQMQGCNLIRNS